MGLTVPCTVTGARLGGVAGRFKKKQAVARMSYRKIAILSIAY
jgi:hypothetical protein